jgi:UDP-glucose 4-epimerase
LNVAVAGASGLIGHAIAQAMVASGRRVLRIGRDPGCDVRLDLARPKALPRDALAGCDVLVHAAGVTDEDFADPASAQSKATDGASALFQAASAAGVKRWTYVSSAHVYGPLEGTIDETTAVRPVSHYARAHLATEEIARDHARAAGASLLVVRPCAVYGMPPALARFARWSLIPFDFPRQALGGRIVLKSAGLQRRNFVSAEGIANLVGWWLGQVAAAHSVANAPGPAEMSVYDFARLCARIVQEETGRHVGIERPAEGPAPALPFQYRTRVAGHLPGPALEDHVRALARMLATEEPS